MTEPAPTTTEPTTERDALLAVADANRDLAMALTDDEHERASIRLGNAELQLERIRLNEQRAAAPTPTVAPDPEPEPDPEPRAADSMSRAEIEVADDLNFDYIDEDVAEDDPLNDPIPIRLFGLVFYLQRPSDSALALRASELHSAPTLMEQYHAMLGVIQTSLEHPGMQMLRQRATGPRIPGKKFDDQIVGKMCKTIFERWGQGRSLPVPADGMNRAQRRQAARNN